MKTLFQMMMILFMMGLYACQQKESQKVAIEKTEVDQEDDFQFPAVSLNEGKLWDANIETTQGIKKMQKIVADFSLEKGNAEEFSKAMKAEFALIFKKCTMKGEAHEQLHNFLFPLKTKIDGLSRGITIEKTEAITIYLSNYFNYFQ